MSNSRIHLWIEGRVQGVCFRHYTRQQALALGLGGWVRNLPDGRVEAVIEGEDSDVKKMLQWCYRGPSMAEVRKIESQEEEPSGEFSSFSVAF